MFLRTNVCMLRSFYNIVIKSRKFCKQNKNGYSETFKNKQILFRTEQCSSLRSNEIFSTRNRRATKKFHLKDEQ